MERSGTWWAPRAFCSVEFSKRDDLRIAVKKKNSSGCCGEVGVHSGFKRPKWLIDDDFVQFEFPRCSFFHVIY